MTTVNTIIQDWWLLAFFFTLGGLWWQGKSWFEGVNKKLGETATTHENQNKIMEGQSEVLQTLTVRVESIHERVERMDSTLSKMHEEVHQQEIKLAVLENITPQRRKRASQ
jgi:hypothetical protein